MNNEIAESYKKLYESGMIAEEDIPEEYREYATGKKA